MGGREAHARDADSVGGIRWALAGATRAAAPVHASRERRFGGEKSPRLRFRRIFAVEALWRTSIAPAASHSSRANPNQAVCFKFQVAGLLLPRTFRVPTMRGFVGRAACCGCVVAATSTAAAAGAMPVRNGEVSVTRHALPCLVQHAPRSLRRLLLTSHTNTVRGSTRWLVSCIWYLSSRV